MNRRDCHPVNYTASLPQGGYIHLEVKCCNKNICNRQIQVPAQKNRPFNGMQCPGCLARIPNANESCSSDATVRCRGQENKCISYTGGLQAPKFNYDPVSFKGCATKNLCDLLTGATEKGNDLLKPIDTVEAECSCAEFPA
ncbi:PREDICTED: phospholipase A2 inhibitor subunit gamma B-like [Gekko japonicus]|uniref:Phospholipase A2 inhibitor subunit gamma B-like n=1 Tax=Gekko japonicus TaxID=146911 RepID=A0ABM1JI77_GEKJA|nr:PREDICTED: phospholipase A2 inhibitor subunit gamma B-like [Gekko japonicus]